MCSLYLSQCFSHYQDFLFFLVDRYVGKYNIIKPVKKKKKVDTRYNTGSEEGKKTLPQRDSGKAGVRGELFEPDLEG